MYDVCALVCTVCEFVCAYGVCMNLCVCMVCEFVCVYVYGVYRVVPPVTIYNLLKKWKVYMYCSVSGTLSSSEFSKSFANMKMLVPTLPVVL